MNPELLTLITPKGPKLERSSRGNDDFRPRVMAALGKLEQPASWYVRVKYAGQAQFWIPLFQHTHEETKEIAAKQHWKATDKQILAITSIALQQSIASGGCEGCKGAGYQKIDEKQVICRTCGGGGYGKHRERLQKALAREIGVSRWTWARKWDRRLQAILGRLSVYEAELGRIIP